MADLVFEGRRRPLVAGRSLFDEADELAVAVPSSCRRSGRCHECVVAVPRGEDVLSPRSAAEGFLPHGFRLACQAHVERTDADVEFSVLRRRLRILLPPAGTSYALDPLVARVGDEVRYGDVPIDHYRGRLLGLALDVGTTTVVAELVDLEAGRPVHAAAFENPQRFGGSDVMTRIAYEGEHPGELRRALRRALNRVLRDAYATLGVERQTVYEAVIVGNPTMRDLFFGLDVAPLGRSPFRSTSEQAVHAGHAQTTSLTRLAHELGLFIHPQARIWGAPLIASHVGADTAADLVATDIAGAARHLHARRHRHQQRDRHRRRSTVPGGLLSGWSRLRGRAHQRTAWRARTGRSSRRSGATAASSAARSAMPRPRGSAAQG